MNIAVINRDSKILTMGCKLEDSGIIRGVFRDNPDYEELADGIMDYIRSDRDVALYGQLMHLVDTVPIRVFLENNKHSSLYGQILEVADVVDRLITFGYQMYEKGSDEFEHLIPFFANEKAEELLKRAANAGLLTPGYRPQPSTQRFQLKLIAICMIEIMGLGHGDKWNHFEELWGTSISRCGIPLTKGLAISKVATLYPEVNLWEIIAPKNNKMVLKFRIFPIVVMAIHTRWLLLKTRLGWQRTCAMLMVLMSGFRQVQQLLVVFIRIMSVQM